MPNTELYNPNLFSDGIPKQGHIYIQNAGYRPVTYTEYDGLAIFEGDIILGTTEAIDKMSVDGTAAVAISGDTIGVLWPNAVIPYEISSDVSTNKAITEAIKYFQTRTSVRLVKRCAKDINYVRFVRSDGCSSFVGMSGGMQQIRIAEWASTGNVIHEIAHAAGLWHQQIDNDYSSIMYCSEADLAKSALKAEVGQRVEMSQRDKLALQAMYLFSNLDPLIDLHIIKGDSPDLDPPEGYTKLNQDLNEGTGGKYIYLCYKKGTLQQMEDAITGIIVITGNSATIQPPPGYQKIDVDLNTGSGGKYIYVCYQRGGAIAITNVTAVCGESSNIMKNIGHGFSLIPQDLNQGVGGKSVYLCYQTSSKL